MIHRLLFPFGLMLSAAAGANTPTPDLVPDPLQTSETDAIECRLDGSNYRAFAFGVEGEEKIARKKGWKKVRSSNPMLLEFDLPAPITVAQSYRTRRIAFTGDGILAVLDLADPNVVAAQEGIANTMDAEPMIAALVATGRATRSEAESLVPFRKFLGEKVVQDVIEPPAQEGGYDTRSRIARTISNTTTHPGKTFYGCAYRFEILDENGEPL